MKTAQIYLIAVLLASFLMASCKTKENCPAYGMKFECKKAQII